MLNYFHTLPHFSWLGMMMQWGYIRIYISKFLCIHFSLVSFLFVYGDLAADFEQVIVLVLLFLALLVN